MRWLRFIADSDAEDIRMSGDAPDGGDDFGGFRDIPD